MVRALVVHIIFLALHLITLRQHLGSSILAREVIKLGRRWPSPNMTKAQVMERGEADGSAITGEEQRTGMGVGVLGLANGEQE